MLGRMQRSTTLWWLLGGRRSCNRVHHHVDDHHIYNDHDNNDHYNYNTKAGVKKMS